MPPLLDNEQRKLYPGFTTIGSHADSEEYFLNMGPQHPSTHGALRIHIRLDGETVKEIVPHMGYIHRGIEKQAESESYLQFIHLTDRMDYLTSHMNNHAVCLAIEKAMDIGVPERGEYIRVIVSELQRISSHLIFMGAFGTDVGGTTSFLYAFREREYITQIFDELCGARLTMNYFRPGGSYVDVTENFIPMVKNVIERLKKFLEEWDRFLTGNIIFQERVKNVGILKPDRAIALGCTGPVLRGSGISYDLRRDEPYSIYDRFNFEIPVGTTGDSWDRYIIRIREVEQSMSIIEQALQQFPEGDYRSKEKPGYRLPEGSTYAAVESAKGLWAVTIEAVKGDKPWRIKVRSPSLSNLAALDEMCRDQKLADIVTILGTIDPVIPDIDR